MQVGKTVGMVAFVSLAIAPWWVLWEGWSWWVLAAVVWWLLVGMVAMFDAQGWERKRR